MQKTRKILASALVSAIVLSPISAALAKKIKSNRPILSERQYFTHKGQNSRSVTLKSLYEFDCHRLMDMYDENPDVAMDSLELVILTQYALEGIDIQTLEERERIALAKAEVGKRLRSYGRLAETRAYLGTGGSDGGIIPSVNAMCHILEDEKLAIFRKKYHDKGWSSAAR